MAANSIFKAIIKKHSSEIGEGPVIINSEKKISYQKLEKLSSELELFFKNNNLDHETPVIVFLPQSLELALVASALLYSGIPALITPSGVKPYEVQELISDYPFSALLTSVQFGNKLNISENAKRDLKIEDDNFLFYKLKNEKTAEVDFSWLLMTSGSTGKSKIVMMSEKNILERAHGEIGLFNIKAQSKVLNVLPFSHDIGLNQLLTALCSGSTLEVFTKKLPVEFANRIALGGFDGVSSMPQIWNNFIQIAKKQELKIEHTGYITVSGGSLPVERLAQLREIFINAKIIKTYGQTETFRSLAEVEQDLIVRNNCGKVLSDVEVLLVNDEDQVCGPGESGQLLNFGARVMSGYWLDQELTELKMKPFGSIKKPVVRTGDYFIMSEDGRYQYEGRKDDMIKHAGRRFFLSEIEACIRNSNLVKDIFLIHAPDVNDHSLGKDKIFAFIIPAEGTSDISIELKIYCASMLETFKVPDEFIVCSAFPMTSNFKVDGPALLKLGKLNGN